MERQITNTEVLTRTNQGRLQDSGIEEPLVCGTHHPNGARARPAHNALDWIPIDGNRGKRGPRKTCRSTLRDDLYTKWITWDEAETLAGD